MFTGIVTGQARIAKIGKNATTSTTPNHSAWGDVRLELDKITGTHDYTNSAIGASISCAGVCLTLVEKRMTSEGGLTLSFDVSNETIQKTTIKSWQSGQVINLESSLHFGDELGGHMVAGHVDGTVALLSKTPVVGSTEFYFTLPPDGRGMIVPKGSVALDGVSLTVNDVKSDRFAVMIIPHTASVTNFAGLKPGDAVNLEYDMLARYVARHMSLLQGNNK